MSSGLPLSQGEIGTQERLKAIDIFSRQCPGSKVTFTGGEALLDPDIFFLMGHARALGLRVELYSNGLTIKNSAIAEQIVRVVHQLQISLDGATQEINDAIRGKGTFKGIVRGIKLIDAAKNALEAHDFSQRIAITLTSTNAQDVVSNLEALLDDMKLHYRPEVHIGTIGNLGRAKIHADLRSNQEAIRLAQAAIANAFVASGIYRLPLSKINRFSKSCGMGTSISIGADGKIYPCTITDQTAIGDIRDSNAEEIMGSVFDHFHKTSVDNIVGCRSCSIRYFCGGICRITNNGKKGSMYVSACTPAYKAGRVRDLVAKYDGFQIV
jgi:radical SAM protein with 4Fe4S-binding SPASM domain